MKDFELEGKSLDEHYMSIALSLAEKGEGAVNPNPLVGAVVVKEGKIIGEGYHRVYGGAHAEINALEQAAELAKGADIYVTLEPCSHYGKTPPCVDAIVKAEIKRVIVGTMDPNILVSGNGISYLKHHGIEVVTGVLEDECKKTNEVFIKYITTMQPYVIIKTAMTLDGKISTVTGSSKWISCEKSRAYVHNLRNKYSAIMVGINTILKDDPLLNTRLENGEGRSPLGIIVDSSLKISLSSRIFSTLNKRALVIATTDKYDPIKKQQIEALGAEVLVIKEKEGRVDLKELINTLGLKGIDSILIEGGAEINYSALTQGIVDKLICFIAPKLVGGASGKTPVGGEGILDIKDAIELENMSFKTLDKDILIEGYIK